MTAGNHVIYIGSAKTNLFTWARGEGCELVRRGDGEEGLAAAIRGMARPAGLVVLDGHGSGWRARYASSSERTGRGVDFVPESIGASHVVMSVCYGRADHYIDAIRATGSPVLDVVGPLDRIGGVSYRTTVEHLIRRFRDGVDPATALAEADGLGVTAASAQWGVTTL